MAKQKFSISYSAPDGRFTKRFTKLADLQKYVKDRWQGTEYIDAPNQFHTDYGRYTLGGDSRLSDLGKRKGLPGSDEFWDWEWHSLDAPQGAPPPAPAPGEEWMEDGL